MGAVDVGVDDGELILKGIADKALGRQMVTFVRLYFPHHLEDTGVTFQRGRVQDQMLQDGLKAPEAVLRVLHGHPPDDPMDFITLVQEKFGQIGAVPAGNSSYQRSFLHQLALELTHCHEISVIFSLKKGQREIEVVSTEPDRLGQCISTASYCRHISSPEGASASTFCRKAAYWRRTSRSAGRTSSR